MGKIKGWRENTEYVNLIEKGNVSKSWIKKNHQQKIVILNEPKSNGYNWNLQFWNKSPAPDTRYVYTGNGRFFNTKKEAQDYAIKYMRSHPQG